MKSIVFHLDIDAFFASVEQIDKPEYRGKPVIVGAKPGNRGVVSACSYEARKFGIRSAMPINQAFQKCPKGIFLPVRMDRYLEVSNKVMVLLKDFTPIFQQISVDEAFLDMTGTQRLFGPVIETAQKIKSLVFSETGLRISIGIASNRYLAKLASDFKKPDGLYQVEDGQEEAFLDQLQLKDLWGLGKKTLERLQEMNITTVSGLRKFPLHILCSLTGEAFGNFLYKAVRGESPEIHSETPKSHSISNEITFDVDRNDTFFIDNILLELAHQVMFRLIEQECSAKTVAIKIRFHDFTTISVQKSSRHNIYSADEIFNIAKSLLYKKWNRHTPIRLIGVSLANLSQGSSHAQAELFEDAQDKKSKVEEAIFKVQNKTGVKVTKASLL